MPKVEGGWYAPVRLPATRSDEAQAVALLEHGVHVHPGYFYDFDEHAWIVISLLTEPETFRTGIETLRRLVAEHV